jgi:hypothetical protein
MLQRLHLNAEGWPSEGHQRVIRGSSEGHQRVIRGSSDGTCSLGLAWHESQPRPLMVGFVSPFARVSANSSAACVA